MKTCMKYYSVRKPLYLETYTSGLGLGAALLQVRNNLTYRYDELPANVMLWPNAFVNKSLSSME